MVLCLSSIDVELVRPWHDERCMHSEVVKEFWILSYKIVNHKVVCLRFGRMWRTTFQTWLILLQSNGLKSLDFHATVLRDWIVFFRGGGVNFYMLVHSPSFEIDSILGFLLELLDSYERTVVLQIWQDWLQNCFVVWWLLQEMNCERVRFSGVVMLLSRPLQMQHTSFAPSLLALLEWLHV